MEVDEGEGAAGDASEVMQGAIEVRWAKVEDKKGYSKVSLVVKKTRRCWGVRLGCWRSWSSD